MTASTSTTDSAHSFVRFLHRVANNKSANQNAGAAAGGFPGHEHSMREIRERLYLVERVDSRNPGVLISLVPKPRIRGFIQRSGVHSIYLPKPRNAKSGLQAGTKEIDRGLLRRSRHRPHNAQDQESRQGHIYASRWHQVFNPSTSSGSAVCSRSAKQWGGPDGRISK